MRKKLQTGDLDTIISDGSALAGGSLVSAAIEADRLRTGRQLASLQASNEASEETRVQTAHTPPPTGPDAASMQSGQPASLQASNIAMKPASLPAASAPHPTDRDTASMQPGQIASLPASNLATLQAPEPTVTMTVRIPISLNDRLDEYAHQHRREKLTKQALVTEALQTYLDSVESPNAA